MFQIGQKVTCITGHACKAIKLNGDYVVEHVGQAMTPAGQQTNVVILKDIVGIYASRRFRAYVEAAIMAPKPKLPKTPVADSILYKALCVELKGHITPYKLLVELNKVWRELQDKMYLEQTYLKGGFLWNTTPQGFKFWEDLDYKADGN
jgi:hypothetical protein